MVTRYLVLVCWLLQGCNGCASEAGEEADRPSLQLHVNDFPSHIRRRCDGDGILSDEPQENWRNCIVHEQYRDPEHPRVRNSRTAAFDRNGRWIYLELDHNDDESIDHIEERDYDRRGRLVHQSIDEEGDGLIDVIRTFRYNRRGWRIERSEDQTGDGNPETIQQTQYFPSGRPRIERVYRDTDSDGDSDRVDEVEWNEEGLIVRSGFDNDGDETLDHISYYEYDSNGQRLHEERDENGDGTMDYCEGEECPPQSPFFLWRRAAGKQPSR